MIASSGRSEELPAVEEKEEAAAEVEPPIILDAVVVGEEAEGNPDADGGTVGDEAADEEEDDPPNDGRASAELISGLPLLGKARSLPLGAAMRAFPRRWKNSRGDERGAWSATSTAAVGGGSLPAVGSWLGSVIFGILLCSITVVVSLLLLAEAESSASSDCSVGVVYSLGVDVVESSDRGVWNGDSCGEGGGLSMSHLVLAACLLLLSVRHDHSGMDYFCPRQRQSLFAACTQHSLAVA